MPEPKRCPECGSEVPPGVPRGLCPRCVLGGMDQHTAASSDEAICSEPACQPAEARCLGDYELIDEIARGGMGVVYKARQRSLDRIVAVKLLGFGPQADPVLVRRFREEALAAGSLQHPNIVAIHEVGLHEGQHFLVMDYVPGENLSRFARENPLPSRRAARYVQIIAQAIQYAHDRGILHRDLKPSNILIDPNDQPRVTDFGLAKRVGLDSLPAGEAAQITATGYVLGSPGYMPPEQAAGAPKKMDFRSDVYSLGATLYHLLTRRPPFVSGSVAETLQQVCEREPISPRRLDPSVDRDLETICLKCLQKNPGERYQTAQAMADDLGRFLDSEPIRARPVGQVEKLWRWAKRKPALASTGSVALLVALWGGYSAWLVQSTKWDASKREIREWALLFDRNSPVNLLHWSSEDLAGFFGERPGVQPHAERLFVGVYLEADQQHMVHRFAPLLRHLERSLSSGARPVKFDLLVFAERAGLEQALTSADPKMAVHLGRIGEAGLSRLLLDTNAGLEPLVQQASGGKTSVIFTRTDTGITNLAGLKNRSLALGSREATSSGYKLLKLLIEQGLTSDDVKASFHRDSGQNVERVLSGQFDAGVTRKDKFLTYTNSELIRLAEFETTRMPWVATRRLAPEMARKIRAAMTNLDDREVLRLLPENPIDGFVAVNAEYFRRVQEDTLQVSKLFFHESAPKPVQKQP